MEYLLIKIKTNVLLVLAFQLRLKNVVFTLNARKSHLDVPYEKVVLENVTKLTRNHLQWSPCCRPPFCNITKKRLYRKYFPTNFVRFFRAAFLQNTYEQVLPQKKFVGLQNVLTTSSIPLRRNNFSPLMTSLRPLGKRKIVITILEKPFLNQNKGNTDNNLGDISNVDDLGTGFSSISPLN